jgi:hypothetical protein
MALCKTARGWQDDSHAVCLNSAGGAGGDGGGGGGINRPPTMAENVRAREARDQRQAKFTEKLNLSELKQSALPDPLNPTQGILPPNQGYAKGGPRATRRDYVKGGPVFR